MNEETDEKLIETVEQARDRLLPQVLAYARMERLSEAGIASAALRIGITDARAALDAVPEPRGEQTDAEVIERCTAAAIATLTDHETGAGSDLQPGDIDLDDDTYIEIHGRVDIRQLVREILEATRGAERMTDQKPMSAIAELRDLQRDYIENRNRYRARIQQQERNLSNCAPSASLIQECREQASEWEAAAALWQRRIDAVQKKLDEAIGLEPGPTPEEGEQ